MQVDKNKQDTSCRRTLGTAKMRTAHLTVEQHRRRKSWDTSPPSVRRGNILAPHPERFSQGVKQRALRWHTRTTHTDTGFHFLPPDFCPTTGLPDDKEEGLKFLHMSTTCPRMHQTFISPPLKCMFVPGWNSAQYMITKRLLMFLQQLSACRN